MERSIAALLDSELDLRADQPSTGSEEDSWTGPSRLEHCLATFLGPDLGEVTKEASRESLASINGATVHRACLLAIPSRRCV